MLLAKTSVKDSPIAGQGLFLEQAAGKGSLIGIYTHDLTILSEEEYTSRVLAGDELVLRTGCRWVDDLFIYNETGVEDEDYINHADNPTLLYHCGLLIARQDLPPGEELTVDYKYILAEWEPGFVCSRSGKNIRGLPGRKAMLESARELLALFEAEEPEKAVTGQNHQSWRVIVTAAKERPRNRGQ
ncbi:MAG: SET domain-containing protein [Thermodesulfobacteriota bacterium]